MGTEALWVPAVLAAVGTGASYYNTQKTAERQDEQLAKQLLQQSARQREADAEVNRLIDDRAQSSSADERSTALQQYLEQARAAAANAQTGTRQVGRLSDEAQQAGADAALGVTDYGERISNLLSRIDAPALSRRNEAVREGRYASEIDRIRRFANGDQFLANLRLRGIQRNPWLDAASSFAGGAASGLAGGGNSGAATAAGNYVGPMYYGLGSVGL